MGTEFKMTRKYRKGVYHITVGNKDKAEKEVIELIVDGKELTDTTIIPYEKGKTEYNVTVVMG